MVWPGSYFDKIQGLFHFPCGATCLTVWRETGSKKWTALAAALPTAVGIALCMAVHFISVLL